VVIMTAARPGPAIVTAPVAPRAFCATCATPFKRPAARPGQLYCSADCRRLAARLSGLRDLADEIAASHPSATRNRAIFALRRMLTAAIAGGPLPTAAEKADRHVNGPRAGTARRRRWCSCCRADLGPVGGRGRPAVSCRPGGGGGNGGGNGDNDDNDNEGRRCTRFRNRAQEVADLVAAIAARPAGDRTAAGRACFAMLRTVTEINREIGL
jgi:hypothetical protein